MDPAFDKTGFYFLIDTSQAYYLEWKLQTVKEMKHMSSISFGMLPEAYMKSIYSTKFDGEYLYVL